MNPADPLAVLEARRIDPVRRWCLWDPGLCHRAGSRPLAYLTEEQVKALRPLDPHDPPCIDIRPGQFTRVAAYGEYLRHWRYLYLTAKDLADAPEVKP